MSTPMTARWASTISASDAAEQERVLTRTTSGGVSVNDVVMHVSAWKICRSAASARPAWARITA